MYKIDSYRDHRKIRCHPLPVTSTTIHFLTLDYYTITPDYTTVEAHMTTGSTTVHWKKGTWRAVTNNDYPVISPRIRNEIAPKHEQTQPTKLTLMSTDHTTHMSMMVSLDTSNYIMHESNCKGGMPKPSARITRAQYHLGDRDVHVERSTQQILHTAQKILPTRKYMQLNWALHVQRSVVHWIHTLHT